jgi:hypothetical protein
MMGNFEMQTAPPTPKEIGMLVGQNLAVRQRIQQSTARLQQELANQFHALNMVNTAAFPMYPMDVHYPQMQMPPPWTPYTHVPKGHSKGKKGKPQPEQHQQYQDDTWWTQESWEG